MQRKSRPRPSEEQRARCLSSRRRCGKRKQLMQQLAQRGGASSWHPAGRFNRLQCKAGSCTCTGEERASKSVDRQQDKLAQARSSATCK